jgi:hypothetical protein
VDDGVRALIRSKTDQERVGQEIAVPRGLKLCPVAWLQAAQITEGRVFRSVLPGGRVTARICIASIPKLHSGD